MPSTSKAQQRLMGQAYAIKTGKLKPKDLDPKYRDQIINLADTMKEDDLKDYAETPHTGLPDTVKEEEIPMFEDFINEGEGTIKQKKKIVKEFVIEYYIDDDLWSDNHSSDREYAEEIALDLSMVEGTITFESNYFEVDGKTIDGNPIFAYQSGEYNMYGGPYTPKMQKPFISIDPQRKTNIYPKVKGAFKKYGWEDGEVDLSRTDIWGNLIK